VVRLQMHYKHHGLHSRYYVPPAARLAPVPSSRGGWGARPMVAERLSASRRPLRCRRLSGRALCYHHAHLPCACACTLAHACAMSYACAHLHRWGLKFFNSEGILSRGLGGKQHTYDMCLPAADILQEQFTTMAHSLSVQRPQAAGACSVASSLETRCKNIKTALQDLLGDGLRDGSLPENTGRKALEGSVASLVRTHHAVYLFSPSTGPAALLGVGGDADSNAAAAAAGFGGLEKGLKNDAKRLSEAFRKYSVVLQVCIYPSSYLSLAVSIQICQSLLVRVLLGVSEYQNPAPPTVKCRGPEHVWSIGGGEGGSSLVRRRRLSSPTCVARVSCYLH
jgi:hypothetical protein